MSATILPFSRDTLTALRANNTTLRRKTKRSTATDVAKLAEWDDDNYSGGRPPRDVWREFSAWHTRVYGSSPDNAESYRNYRNLHTEQTARQTLPGVNVMLHFVVQLTGSAASREQEEAYR